MTAVKILLLPSAQLDIFSQSIGLLKKTAMLIDENKSNNEQEEMDKSEDDYDIEDLVNNAIGH